MAKLEYISVLDLVVGDIVVSHNDFMLIQDVFFGGYNLHINYFSLTGSRYKYQLNWNVFGDHKIEVIKKNEYRRFTFSKQI